MDWVLQLAAAGTAQKSCLFWRLLSMAQYPDSWAMNLATGRNPKPATFATAAKIIVAS
jgi:hypothetical protein